MQRVIKQFKQYPNGRFSHLAQEKIQKYVLKMNQTQVASVNDIEKTKKYIEEADNILLKKSYKSEE
jgi:predicted peptidase